MEIEPSATACAGMAAVALKKGDQEGAMRWYDQGIQLDPDFAAIWYLRGQLWEKKNQLQQAVTDYRESVVREPGFFPAVLSLAGVLKKQGDLPAAKKILILS